MLRTSFSAIVNRHLGTIARSLILNEAPSPDLRLEGAEREPSREGNWASAIIPQEIVTFLNEKNLLASDHSGVPGAFHVYQRPNGFARFEFVSSLRLTSSKYFVESLYRFLLGRSCDPQGLRDYHYWMESEQMTPLGVLMSIASSGEARDRTDCVLLISTDSLWLSNLENVPPFISVEKRP